MCSMICVPWWIRKAMGKNGPLFCCFCWLVANASRRTTRTRIPWQVDVLTPSSSRRCSHLAVSRGQSVFGWLRSKVAHPIAENHLWHWQLHHETNPHPDIPLLNHRGSDSGGSSILQASHQWFRPLQLSVCGWRLDRPAQGWSRVSPQTDQLTNILGIEPNKSRELLVLKKA